MVYSKRISDLQQIYQLTPEEVFFCMLVASGANRAESFAIIFKPRSARLDAAAKGATTLAHDKPGINKLIQSFNLPSLIPVEEVAGTKRKRKGEKSEDDGRRVQYRDKDAVLSGLEETLPELRGKDKADVLMKIADLQQMKKDENAEEVEQVLYYHPLQCYRCSLFLAEKAKKSKEKGNS